MQPRADKPPTTGNKQLARQIRKILGKHYAPLSRRGGAALLPDRSRGAVKKGSGDAGRYSRSFGLSASVASPPCGEWKAYRVTAAIARKLN